MWSEIGPERRTETPWSCTSSCQLRGKAMFSLKTTGFISTNPACNLLRQLSKQPCSTRTLAQLWKPTVGFSVSYPSPGQSMSPSLRYTPAPEWPHESWRPALGPGSSYSFSTLTLLISRARITWPMGLISCRIK